MIFCGVTFELKPITIPNEKFNKILLPLNDETGMMKVAKYAIRVALALGVGIDILTITNKLLCQS